jgi:hypothetical protein
LALAKGSARGLSRTDSKDAEAISAITLALAGDSVEAAGRAGDLAGRFPQDTIVQRDYLPMIGHLRLWRAGPGTRLGRLRSWGRRARRTGRHCHGH